MSFKMVRTLNETDKALLAAVLMNAGVKARIRKFPGCYRVVFDGARETVADALNGEGFLAAGGQPFGRFSFDGNQAFVRYVAA